MCDCIMSCGGKHRGRCLLRPANEGVEGPCLGLMRFELQLALQAKDTAGHFGFLLPAASCLWRVCRQLCHQPGPLLPSSTPDSFDTESSLCHDSAPCMRAAPRCKLDMHCGMQATHAWKLLATHRRMWGEAASTLLPIDAEAACNPACKGHTSVGSPGHGSPWVRQACIH